MGINNRGHRNRIMQLIESLPPEDIEEEVPVCHYFLSSIPVIFNWGSPELYGSASTVQGVPPEVIQMLRSTVYFNSIYEKGFLELLEYILGIPFHQKD